MLFYLGSLRFHVPLKRDILIQPGTLHCGLGRFRQLQFAPFEGQGQLTRRSVYLPKNGWLHFSGLLWLISLSSELLWWYNFLVTKNVVGLKIGAPHNLVIYHGLWWFKASFSLCFQFPIRQTHMVKWCYIDREANAAIDNYHLRMVYKTHKNDDFGYGLVYGIIEWTVNMVTVAQCFNNRQKHVYCILKTSHQHQHQWSLSLQCWPIAIWHHLARFLPVVLEAQATFSSSAGPHLGILNFRAILLVEVKLLRLSRRKLQNSQVSTFDSHTTVYRNVVDD